MSRALQIGTVALAAVTVLSACSGGSNPAGSSPSSTAAAATGTSAQGGEAPKVPAALPTAALISNACTALATGQMNELGMAPPGKPSTNAGGPTCQWNGATNTSNSAFINVMTANKSGLSDIYANNDNKEYAYFEPVTIDGYPGVYAEPTDDRSQGSCTAWIGVTDQLAVGVAMILLTGANRANPCDSANKVATAMIEHLKSAA